MLWDIFCKVIDNHGDIGVCWRLAAQLADRGEQVRLWVDDARALQWMAPRGHPGVSVRGWTPQAPFDEPGDVVIEAFGCQLDASFLASIAAASLRRAAQPVWINLEYLTAEPFAQRSHGLPSPVMHGPSAGLVKHFFYPGFTEGTGGLLREPHLMARAAAFRPAEWLAARGLSGDERRVSLFCYEPPGLRDFLAARAQGPGRTRVMVTAGRATQATRTAIDTDPALAAPSSALRVSWLHYVDQPAFDELLWACDFNFVRGEDSLVRALWAGRPFVWHVYPQHDDAHHAKLLAFLDWLDAPRSLREFHLAWNGFGGKLPAFDLAPWQECVHHARARLLAQDDLVTQLLRFTAPRNP